MIDLLSPVSFHCWRHHIIQIGIGLGGMAVRYCIRHRSPSNVQPQTHDDELQEGPTAVSAIDGPISLYRSVFVRNNSVVRTLHLESR